MKRLARWRWIAAMACLTAACMSCGPPPAAVKMEKDAEKVEAEREPHKLLARGKAFARMGDLTRAEQYLTAALDEGADPKETLPILMQICLQSGRYRVAIEYAGAELGQRPHNVPLRFLLGSLYLAVGNTPEARLQMERVLAVQPNHAEAHFALGVIARDSEGDLIRADRHFRAYLRLRPDGPHAEEARNSLLESVP